MKKQKEKGNLKISGRLDKCVSELSSKFEMRYSQLQDLEAILGTF